MKLLPSWWYWHGSELHEGLGLPLCLQAYRLSDFLVENCKFKRNIRDLLILMLSDLGNMLISCC